jgi:DNA-binding GntR family transcriptional regulator
LRVRIFILSGKPIKPNVAETIPARAYVLLAEWRGVAVVEPIAKLAPLQHQAAPLRSKIIAALRNAIETGLLQPGARLVERDLCGQLNVSRTSLREALRELQADGVLFQSGARGLAVSRITPEEAANAYRIRAVLEALAVEQFIERASDDDIRHIGKDAEALKAAYRSGDVTQMLLSRRAFYDRICTIAGNALAFDIINRLVLRTSALRSRSLSRKQRQQQSQGEIDAILKAIRKRDTAGAKRAAIAHVEGAATSALGDVERADKPAAVKSRKPRRKTTGAAASKSRS